jgi:spermidine synthase
MNMEASHSRKVAHVGLRGIPLYCGLTIYPFVFFSGFANLATEIIGPRMLSSLLGSSTTIWAVMISVTLTGLSAGYFVGGRLNLKWARKSLPVILFANALYLLAVSWVVWHIPPQAANYGIGVIILITLLLFFVPAAFFGTISPIAVTLLSQNRNPDQMPRVSGSVYAIGTLGNIAGALSAAFILIPYVGLSSSLRLFSAGLVLFALYFWFANRSNAKDSNSVGRLSTTVNHKVQISDTTPVNEYALFVFVFFSGFANLATEIIAPRMFSSLLGPTTILWAIIISVALIGLAIGYFAGGRIPLSHARLALYIILPLNACLLLAASWLVWELPLLLLPITFKSVVVVALAAFFLSSVLFGMNSQIAITLLSGSRSFKNVSNVVGNVYATGTIGAVLGALFAALFFIPHVGLSASLRWFAAGLIVFEFYFLVGRFRVLALPLFAVCLLLPQPDWRWEDTNRMTLLTQREGYYQTIRVFTNGTTFVRFQLGPTHQSEMDINTRERW